MGILMASLFGIGLLLKALVHPVEQASERNKDISFKISIFLLVIIVIVGIGSIILLSLGYGK